MKVPTSFAETTLGREGERARPWLGALPDVVEKLCDRWELRGTDNPVMHGYLGIVVPVSRGEEQLVLKISWIDSKTRDEAKALRFWDGAGAVRLLASDEELGALLLERLDSSRSLDSVPITEAIPVAAGLLRRLSVPCNQGFVKVTNHREYLTGKWEKYGRPTSQLTFETAMDCFDELVRDSDSLLVNEDLHYENVLAAGREPWLVIDPKPIIADAEFGVAPLVWNRTPDDAHGIRHRIDEIVDLAGFDPRKANGWTLHRTVDYHLWALGLGYNEDAAMCSFIEESLIGRV